MQAYSSATPGNTYATPASGLPFSSWRKQHPLLISAVIGTLLFLLLEDLTSRYGWINSAKFPPALDVLTAFAQLVSSGQIWPPLTATLITWALSVLNSLLVALLLSLLVNLNDYTYAGTRTILEFIRPVPSTALIPLVILALGSNVEGALFLTFFGTVWQVLPIFLAAVHATDPVALDVARCFGLTKRQILLSIRLPSMVPYLKTAIRIGSSAALVLLVSMEYLASISGIGKEIAIAYAGSNYTRLYAFVLLASILGLLVNLSLAAWANPAVRRDGKE